MSHNQFLEAQTRYNIIDPALVKAGYKLSDRTQIWFEVPVQGYDSSPSSGITDYCIFRPNGEVLAVIEAKKTRRDARVGKEQVLRYVTEIEKKQSFRPPLHLQQKFASLVERVEQLLEKQRESERKLEALFMSLMNKYFG